MPSRNDPVLPSLARLQHDFHCVSTRIEMHGGEGEHAHVTQVNYPRQAPSGGRRRKAVPQRRTVPESRPDEMDQLLPGHFWPFESNDARATGALASLRTALERLRPSADAVTRLLLEELHDPGWEMGSDEPSFEERVDAITLAFKTHVLYQAEVRPNRIVSDLNNTLRVSFGGNSRQLAVALEASGKPMDRATHSEAYNAVVAALSAWLSALATSSTETRALLDGFAFTDSATGKRYLKLDAMQWVVPVQVYDARTHTYKSARQDIHSDVGPSSKRSDSYGPRTLLAVAVDADGAALRTHFYNEDQNAEGGFVEVVTEASTSSVGAFDTLRYHAGPTSSCQPAELAAVASDSSIPWRLAPICKMFFLFITPGFNEIQTDRLRETQGVDMQNLPDLLGQRVEYHD